MKKIKIESNKDVEVEVSDSQILSMYKGYEKSKKLKEFELKTDFKTITEVITIMYDMTNEDDLSLFEIIQNLKDYSDEEVDENLNTILYLYKKKLHKIINLMTGKDDFDRDQEVMIFMSAIPFLSIFAGIKNNDGDTVQLFGIIEQIIKI